MCLLLIAALSGMSKSVVSQQLPQVNTTLTTQMKASHWRNYTLRIPLLSGMSKRNIFI
jgi:hypothetical protein